MTFAPGNPIAERVILVDIEVGHRIDTHSWLQAGAPNTGAWYIAHTHTDKFGEHEGEPARVRENGVELDPVASIAACHAAAASWYWDPATLLLYVHSTAGGDPGGGASIIVANTWRRFATRPYIFGGRPYIPLVANDSIPPVAYVTGGYHEGGTKQTFGTVKFLNGEEYFDNDLSDYIYEGKRFTSRIGDNGAAEANFAVFWDGWTSDIDWSLSEVSIAVEDLMTAVL